MLKKISVATVLTFAVITKASAFGLLLGILTLGGGVAAGVPVGMGIEANNHVIQGQQSIFDNIVADHDKSINDWCTNVEPNNLDGCKATKKAQLQKFAEDWNSDTPEAKEFAASHAKWEAAQAQPATQPAK